MNKKIEKGQNIDNIKIIETNPDDGFVHQADINNTNMNNYGKYHKGYSKNISISTNDPRITRPFAFVISGLLLGIGIMTLLINLLDFDLMSIIVGLIFIILSIFAFFKSKKDIDNIEKNY